MKIAVCSADFHRLTGHAGRARHWLMFEGEPGGPVTPLGPLELAAEQVFHHHRERDGTHPLENIGAMLTRSAGDNLIDKLRRWGIETRITSERDPAKAAAAYLAGALPPPPPPSPMQAFCKVHDFIDRRLRTLRGERHRETSNPTTLR